MAKAASLHALRLIGLSSDISDQSEAATILSPDQGVAHYYNTLKLTRSAQRMCNTVCFWDYQTWPPWRTGTV
jgi:hypothetical protein